MRVLLIGAGRYGNNLVGRKYASGQLGVRLAGVIDPKIDEIKKGANYYMGGIPTYHSLREVPKKLLKDTVADVALLPQIVPKVFEELSNVGIKKLILPKPVTTNFEEYKKICSLAEEHNMQALVASNWHYSNITKELKSLVKEVSAKNRRTSTDTTFTRTLKTSGYDINKVTVEYSKQNEVLDIDPPLQELPHALQILHSSELVKDFDSTHTVLNKNLQSNSRVNLSITNADGIKEGININSDLQSGTKLKNKRERKVEIYFDNNGDNSKITADYDAVFDMSGVCEKYPEITYEYTEGKQPQKFSYKIEEDNINKMYDEMFKTFSDRSNTSLTLDGYKPIAEYLSDVEQQWLKR